MAVFIPSIAATPIERRDLNVKFVHGEVNATSDISKRNNIPTECQFGDSHSTWYYLQITGLSEGTACFGWPDGPWCGDKGSTWSDPDWTDIQTAMAKVVTLDGQLQSSTSGSWHGTFFLGTTAFSDRDTSLFDLALAESKVQTPIYYWSRDGDFAQVVGHNANCP